MGVTPVVKQIAQSSGGDKGIEEVRVGQIVSEKRGEMQCKTKSPGGTFALNGNRKFRGRETN